MSHVRINQFGCFHLCLTLERCDRFIFTTESRRNNKEIELESTYAVTNYLLELIDYLGNQFHAHTCANLHMHCIILSWAISCEPARPRLSLSCTPCTHSTTCTAHVQTCDSSTLKLIFNFFLATFQEGLHETTPTVSHTSSSFLLKSACLTLKFTQSIT